MDVLSADHPAREVAFMKSVQSAGTECGNNWVGWFLATQRAPMMVVQPTQEMAERWSKQRLAPMIEETPQLRALVRPARERDSGNTTLLKEFPGGVLLIAGANSAAGLRSMPVQYMMLDEVDAYPQELEGEGDPIALAEGRTTTFMRRKVFKISTPTIESLSRIHPAYEESDQRLYMVPCPECGHMQSLEWEQLIWEPGKPKTARYACADCGALIPEHHKTKMLRAGKWEARFPDRDAVGFKIHSLYTPIGLGLSWAELAKEFEKAQKNPQKLKAFNNLRLARVNKDPTEKFDWEDIKARADIRREPRDVPPGVVLITVGVDVQKDRFSAMWLGWARDFVAVLDWDEIEGNPTKPEDYAALEERIGQPFVSCRGVQMKVEMSGIDSGNWQDDVLQFSTPRERRGWFGLKGTPTQGGIMSRTPSAVDVTWRGRFSKQSGKQWKVGTRSTKEFLFSRLTADGKTTSDKHAIRFPSGLPDEFYMQLTAEVYDPAKGRYVKLSGRKNEGIDTFCYAVAAAYHPRVGIRHWGKSGTWASRLAVYEPAAAEAAARGVLPAEPVLPPGSPPLRAPSVDDMIAAARARLGG